MSSEPQADVAGIPPSGVRRVVLDDLSMAVILGVGSFVLYEVQDFYGDWDWTPGFLPWLGLTLIGGVVLSTVDWRRRRRAPTYDRYRPPVRRSAFPLLSGFSFAVGLVVAALAWKTIDDGSPSVVGFATIGAVYSVQGIVLTVRTILLERRDHLWLYRPSGSPLGPTRYFFALPAADRGPEDHTQPGDGVVLAQGWLPSAREQ